MNHYGIPRTGGVNGATAAGTGGEQKDQPAADDGQQTGTGQDQGQSAPQPTPSAPAPAPAAGEEDDGA